MDVLLVKMSSLGDVVHTLPAVQDALALGINVHWVVEEGYVPLVDRVQGISSVIPAAFRRWRRTPGRSMTELLAFLRELQSKRYDAVIDAQGLIKSAFVATRANAADRVGFDRSTARESLASFAYGRHFHIPVDAHAIDRLRDLFAYSLGYLRPSTPPRFGLDVPAEQCATLVLLHGTTWRTKLWPEVYWVQLAELAVARGLEPVLMWGTQEEQARAIRVAEQVDGARVIDRTTLTEATNVLASAAGVIGVDSGLAHLSAALGRPTVMLFGPTDAGLTGCRGPSATNLSPSIDCAPCRSRDCRKVALTDTTFPPCFATVTPERAWQAFEDLR